ncbi:MAG: 16S rRNA (guanine(966)-N(2))-methyltransferase RsmD [Gammaproteobacteria bacterium]|nr:16S rRNA (guanine(966)-N(2))-methyltransferase RsmD [Gammaproteobacteria bacterium]MBT8109521.1 16S rRNA (guanine(966)-N(2))-methyltransferase RsmD [Gammaproteobacteria bacterium]NND46114.1 16S rRNA (guanine(966)-N(2))-methyltransferase RsmD [Woeseiaceae bacterium]NNL44223.1 16S rRNA (guanine(966)-N(2))-methyltransferase RsmD [Woeseiaceae bacterium]
MAKRQKTSKARPGRLRIVAGNWRSRLLDIADVAGLRPTSARIRETLFNWLEPRIHGAHCLDLFAGTGALGLEALSRGAGSAVFVEKSMRAASTLNANIRTLGAAGAVVRHTDALNYLRGDNTEQFDLVFLDPPFAAGMIEEVCSLLAERKLLTKDACIYIEQERSRAEPDLPEGWEVLKNKTAGSVRYMLVRQRT